MKKFLRRFSPPTDEVNMAFQAAVSSMQAWIRRMVFLIAAVVLLQLGLTVLILMVVI